MLRGGFGSARPHVRNDDGLPPGRRPARVALYAYTVHVYVERVWADGRVIPKDKRRATPGTFEVEVVNGVRVARLLSWGRAHPNPNIIPVLYEPQIVKASGTLMRVRGWERPEPTVVAFQEWIIDFHREGYGKYAEGGR